MCGVASNKEYQISHRPVQYIFFYQPAAGLRFASDQVLRATSSTKEEASERITVVTQRTEEFIEYARQEANSDRRQY